MLGIEEEISDLHHTPPFNFYQIDAYIFRFDAVSTPDSDCPLRCDLVIAIHAEQVLWANMMDSELDISHSAEEAAKPLSNRVFAREDSTDRQIARKVKCHTFRPVCQEAFKVPLIQSTKALVNLGLCKQRTCPRMSFFLFQEMESSGQQFPCR